MAAREENILNVPISETLEGMHVLCDTGDTGEPYRVAASLFIAEATQAAKYAVANLDPKDVILKGFTALTAGKPAITANSTLLAAIQSLYAMAGSGKVKIISDGADQTGMVCWNGTSASGFVINVNEAAIYTRSQWTQSNPDSVTDANWIAAVKTGGTKNPFNALNTLLTGWINRATQKPTITSANTIFDALKALYWASGNGNVLNISNGGNRFGFVGWDANTAYGFMLDTANFTIYIRQWAQAQATSNANTAALWREAIQGGEAFSLKQSLNVYNYSGSGNIPSGDLAKVGAAEVFVYEIGGQRAPLFKVTGDDTMTQFSSAPIVESGDPSSGEPLKIHYMSVEVNLSTGTVKTDIVPISGSGGTSNVIHGNDITEGLEYLVPENVGDVVAFRSTMDSAQVPAEQEGFGFLAKVNGSESMAMMMQNDPAGGGKMKFFMGRVQNDGTGTDWQELTTGSSTGTAFEKISAWDDTSLASCPIVHADNPSGQAYITTTREIKATDILLITWMKTGGHSPDFHLQGSAIIHPAMIDSDATYDVALDFLDDWTDNGNYYGMTLYNSQETLVGQKDMTFLFIGSGNFPAVAYSITGIYNISGK